MRHVPAVLPYHQVRLMIACCLNPAFAGWYCLLCLRDTTTTDPLQCKCNWCNCWHCTAVRIMQRQSVQASWRSALSKHVIVFKHGPTLLEMVE